MTIFKGSGVAIVTPFKADGSIHFDELKRLIEFQIENGTDAIIVCGTTGEASTLSDEEQIETIRFTVDAVNKRIPVIAGAGSNHTDHGIDLCKASQKAGADGCLLVTPYYNKTTQKGLYEHYIAHAKSIDIPIILYNVPSRTGLNIDPKTAAALSKVENIVAIKEASDNISQIMDVAHACNGDLDIYSGNDNQITPILSIGGKGVISVIANIAPKETHDLCQLYFDGKYEESLALQLRMLPLVKAIFSEVNPIPVKTAFKYMGYEGVHFRRPLVPMEAHNEVVLLEEMKKFGIDCK